MQSPPKPQFASWLLEQVRTGQYTGLCYIGQNKFRVPWKHNSRKDCNEEDCKIFKAWAVASGKINDFPDDKARWKTNFRCALNHLSKHFKMIDDNSRNSEDPHKIYEVINTGSNYESPPQQDSHEGFDMPVDIYSSPAEFNSSADECNLAHKLMALDLGNQPIDGWVQEFFVGSYPATATVGNNTQLLPNAESYYEVNPHPVDGSPPQPSIYDLEISINYRKKQMLKLTLNASRLQLHYNHEDPELNAYHLCFPTTEGLLDHKQIEYTNRILNIIQRGLLLEVRDTGIYAYRQDSCRVFASTDNPSTVHPNPRKLPQNTMVELLSFEKYVNELKLFKEANGVSPSYTVSMCFGEMFPDGKPLEKKLIVVQVVPLICRYFHELAQMEGASSLQSTNVSLQISHNSLYDLINSVFSLPGSEDPGRAAELFLNHM